MEDESFTLDQAEDDVEEDINNVREILNRSLSEPDLTKDYDRLIHAHSGKFLAIESLINETN